MPDTATLSLLDAGPVPVEATALAPSRTDSDTVAVPLLQDGDDLVLGPGAAELEEDLGTDLLALVEALEAKGAAGELTRVPAQGRQVYVVGVGAGSADDLRKAGAALGRRTRGRASVAASVPAVGDREQLLAFVAGFVLAGFSFSLRRDADPAQAPAGSLLLALEEGAAGLPEAVAIATASWRARWLASVPSNVKNPPWLADQAVALAEASGLSATVWDEDRLARERFGGILAVGQGSATPPRLVQLDYVPPKGRKAPRVVLVGKGITFDTGGLNLKPGDSMVNMRRDMTGAAVVAAVLAALPALGCPVRVTGLLACAENAVSGTSMRPGDVITHYGGLTSEVNNTDAEGRLVMADALAYAAAELDPAVLVDVATLTGAVKVALGLTLGGLFATSDELAAHLEAAADAAAEPVWRLPLAEELYGEYVEGTVADLDNAPSKVGTIAAALFLQRFTGGLPWAHLDIASVGDSGADRDEWTKGPSGFGARLLLHWLGAAEPLKGVS